MLRRDFLSRFARTAAAEIHKKIMALSGDTAAGFSRKRPAATLMGTGGNLDE